MADKTKLMAGDVVLHKGQKSLVVCGPDRHNKYCIDVPVCSSHELRLVPKGELAFQSHDPYDTYDVDLPQKSACKK